MRSTEKYVVVPGRREGRFVVRKRAVPGFTLAKAASPRASQPAEPTPARLAAPSDRTA